MAVSMKLCCLGENLELVRFQKEIRELLPEEPPYYSTRTPTAGMLQLIIVCNSEGIKLPVGSHLYSVDIMVVEK